VRENERRLEFRNRSGTTSMSMHVVGCALLCVVFGTAVQACVSSPRSCGVADTVSAVSSADKDARVEMGTSGLPLKSLIEQVNRCGSRQLAIIDPALEDLRLGGAICGCDVENIALALQRLGLPVVETTRAPLVHRSQRE
jgi:hypothetical protein